jgi:hypothetical protein
MINGSSKFACPSDFRHVLCQIQDRATNGLHRVPHWNITGCALQELVLAVLEHGGSRFLDGKSRLCGFFAGFSPPGKQQGDENTR